MTKKILIALIVVLIGIQFIRPEKNLSDDNTYGLATVHKVPVKVDHLLKVACNDCHSNKTEYPWYAEVQPVAWWLADHVEDGKRHLNFSTFTKLPIAVQNHKFEEVVEMVEEREMPLDSYTYLGLHPGADLSDDERRMLIQWANAQMDLLKSTYPADSLVLKRRRPPSTTK
ncbi:MAG: heme-binding domain-containing protein [Sediminicola sp.]